MDLRPTNSIVMLPATGERWSELCKRVTTRPPCQIRFTALPTDGSGRVSVMWSFATRCSNCGRDIEVGDARDVPDDAMPEAKMVAWLRENALRTLTHEFDECFMLDGKLVNDPHPGSNRAICVHP